MPKTLLKQKRLDASKVKASERIFDPDEKNTARILHLGGASIPHTIQLMLHRQLDRLVPGPKNISDGITCRLQRNAEKDREPDFPPGATRHFFGYDIFDRSMTTVIGTMIVRRWQPRVGVNSHEVFYLEYKGEEIVSFGSIGG